MRRRVTTGMTVLTAVVVGLSLRASVQGHPGAAVPAGIVASTPGPNTTRSALPRKRTKEPVPSTTPSGTRPSTVAVNGAVTDTMYGPVQVQIIVRGARIVSSHAIDYPQGGGRDQQINSHAIPRLDQETLQTQSARIDTVSGATYTSEGYRRSLQSALDAAHRMA